MEARKRPSRNGRTKLHRELVPQTARYRQLNTHSLSPPVADVGASAAGKFWAIGSCRKSRVVEL